MVSATVTACDTQPLPLDEWERSWRETVEFVQASAGPGITVEECEDVLAYLREQRDALGPTPLPDLEAPVDSWFAVTESVFFDCQLAGAGAQESLETARALEGEVDVVLSLEG